MRVPRPQERSRSASSNSSFGLEEEIGIDGSLAPAAETDLNAVLQAASLRPELRALEAAVQEAEAESQLGRTFSKPDYGLGIRYAREEGDQIVLGGLTLTLPVFSKGQELRAVGAARAARLRAELDAARTRVQLEVRVRLRRLHPETGSCPSARNRSHSGSR